MPSGAQVVRRSIPVTDVERLSFSRITVRTDQLGGVPCIRGLRIPVVTILKLLATGCSEDDILRDYPDLEREEIREALAFAAAAIDER